MTKTKIRAVLPIVLAIAGFFAPSGAQAQGTERSGKQVVDAQCSKCHAKGVKGAPKIGDKAAWTPRMKQGIDALVASAIRGRGSGSLAQERRRNGGLPGRAAGGRSALAAWRFRSGKDVRRDSFRQGLLPRQRHAARHQD